MVEDILQYVLSLQHALSAASLEDMAVCSAHCRSFIETPRQRSGYSELPALIEAWVNEPEPVALATFGRRQQVLLRALVDVLDRRGVDHLSRDETEFLLAAYDLAKRKRNERAFELLEPHHEEILQRHDKLRPTPGMMQLFTRVRVVTAERIQKSPRRQVAMFSGQPRSAPIPTLEMSGPVRILGSIPHECAVIIATGPCSVNGYVLGWLSVADDCDIRDNIGGCLVANAGNVYCRNVIEKATVVVKMGSIKMINGMGPAAVFAAGEIQVAESISRGKYFGTRINVRKKVTGGEFHVSDAFVAEYLEPADGAPLNVVLRTELTCEDYGEQAGPEVARLKARGAYLRRKLSHLGHMVRSTQAEAEHAASTAVLRAFSDTRLMAAIEERARVARRLAILNRLITVMHELYAGAEESLSIVDTGGDDEDARQVFTDMEADLDELSREGHVDQDLNDERIEIRNLYDKLGWTRTDHNAMLGMMSDLRERMEPWIVERQLVMGKFDRLTSEITKAVPEAGLDALAQGAQAAREPKLAALQRKIMTLKQNPPNAEIKKRLQTPLVMLMINVMQRRIYRLNELGASIRKCKEEQAAVAEDLRSLYRVGAPEGDSPARVSGRFAPGVRIYRDIYALKEPSALPGAVLTTTGNEKPTTYVRGLASIIVPSQSDGPSTLE